MASCVFETESLREILRNLDWDAIARGTVGASDGYMPGASYLDAKGNVGFAVTMGEVDGPLLALAYEDNPRFELASWVTDVAPKTQRSAEAAFAPLLDALRPI